MFCGYLATTLVSYKIGDVVYDCSVFTRVHVDNCPRSDNCSQRYHCSHKYHCSQRYYCLQSEHCSQSEHCKYLIRQLSIQEQFSCQSPTGIPAKPGFDDFVPVPVPAGMACLAGILAGIFVVLRVKN